MISASGFHQNTQFQLGDGTTSLVIAKLTPLTQVFTLDPATLSHPHPEQVLFTVHHPQQQQHLMSTLNAVHLTLETANGEQIDLTVSKAQYLHRMTSKDLKYRLDPASLA